MTTTIFWPWSIGLLNSRRRNKPRSGGKELGQGAPVRVGNGELIDLGKPEPSPMLVRQNNRRWGKDLEGNAMVGEWKLELENWRNFSGLFEPRQDPHPAPASL